MAPSSRCASSRLAISAPMRSKAAVALGRLRAQKARRRLALIPGVGEEYRRSRRTQAPARPKGDRL